MLILYLDRMCMGKAAPFIQDELGLADWQMGWVHAAFTLAYALFEVPTGHLGDRYGSRRVLLRIVLWWSAFTALTGAATGFWMLVCVRFLFGAGEAGALPNAARVVDRWFPPNVRGRVRGLVHMPALLGAVLAPLGTAYLIEAVGWRWVFVLFGGLGALWAGGFSRWFRETPAEHSQVNAAELLLIGPPPTPSLAAQLPLGAFIASRNVWLLSVVMSAGCAAVYLMFSWYPTYLERVRGVSNVESGWLAAGVMLGGAVGCMTGGWSADQARKVLPVRWAFPTVGAAGFGLAAAAVIGSAMIDSILLKTALLSLGCFGIHCHAAAWWGTASSIGGRHTAATFAIVNSVGVLAGAGAQLGFGALPREKWGMLSSFPVCCSLLARYAGLWSIPCGSYSQRIHLDPACDLLT